MWLRVRKVRPRRTLCDFDQSGSLRRYRLGTAPIRRSGPFLHGEKNTSSQSPSDTKSRRSPMNVDFPTRGGPSRSPEPRFTPRWRIGCVGPNGGRNPGVVGDPPRPRAGTAHTATTYGVDPIQGSKCRSPEAALFRPRGWTGSGRSGRGRRAHSTTQIGFVKIQGTTPRARTREISRRYAPGPGRGLDR
jgi:hypothetical protein